MTQQNLVFPMTAGHGRKKSRRKDEFFVVLQQMLALFAMIFIGFYAYKVHWVTQDTSDRLSKLLVNILNPALSINGVLDKTVVAKKRPLAGKSFLYLPLFCALIGLSFQSLKSCGGKMENRYQLMLIFSNVGFMGIRCYVPFLEMAVRSISPFISRSIIF